MTPRKIFFGVFFLVVALLLLGSVYTVRESQRALLLRLGKIVESKPGVADVKQPGIHFKLPFINQAKVFDVRLQTLDIESSRYVTAQKKDVWVDSFVKWRIADLPLYYTRTAGDEFKAESLLKQIVNDGLRGEFGKRNIQEVVSGERTDIMALLRTQADKSAKNYGIKVIDVRIKGIDLPKEVSNAVFDRMRAERERSATEHRAKGKAAAEAIRAQADAKVTVTLAQANSDGKRIQGEGDAEAAKIYADAYGKNEEFFALYRSLDAYKQVFKNKKDILVLKPDSQFFKYFNQANSHATNKQ